MICILHGYTSVWHKTNYIVHFLFFFVVNSIVHLMGQKVITENRFQSYIPSGKPEWLRSATAILGEGLFLNFVFRYFKFDFSSQNKK